MEIELTRNYLDLYRLYEQRGVNTALNPADSEFTGDVGGYFSIGRQGLDICVDALVGNNLAAPRTILDIPSGSGRVLRHLVAFFPDATIHASDLYEHHLSFCREEFGVETFLSKTNPDDNHFPCSYDLIFIGSLLSHLPLAGMQSMLRLVARSLNEGGIAVMTTEGRFTVHAHHNLWKLVNEDNFDAAYAGYLENGFGFVDYANHRSQFHKQDHYGFALAHPAFVVSEICKHQGLRILSCKEHAWNNHQDCYVVQKTSIPLS
jgi:SAM-dependent methyltransferase